MTVSWTGVNDTSMPSNHVILGKSKSPHNSILGLETMH